MAAAAVRALKTAKAMGGEMGCGFCHEIEAAGDDAAVPWKIRPVAVTEHWLPAARFSHDRHRSEKSRDPTMSVDPGRVPTWRFRT